MKLLTRIAFLISCLFILNGCDPTVIQDIDKALGGGTTGSSGSSGKVCMYNPSTQGMSWCHHKTTSGKCAHYGSPC